MGTLSSGILINAVVEVILLYLLIGFVSFYFNQVLRSTKLVGNNDFSVMFLSVVVMSGLGYSLVSFQFVFGFFLLLVLINKIQQGFNQTENIISEFEMGVLVGMLTIINPLFVVVLPFTIVALVNVKVNTWRGYFAVALGFSFMMLLKWSYFIFTDHINPLTNILKLSFFPKSLAVHGLKMQVSSVLLVVIFLASMNYFMRNSAQLNIKIRVYYKVWMWLSLFLLSGLLLIENSMTWPQLLLCINLPLMVLYQVLVKSIAKKVFKELAVLLLVAVVLFLKLGI